MIYPLGMAFGMSPGPSIGPSRRRAPLLVLVPLLGILLTWRFPREPAGEGMSGRARQHAHGLAAVHEADVVADAAREPTWAAVHSVLSSAATPTERHRLGGGATCPLPPRGSSAPAAGAGEQTAWCSGASASAAGADMVPSLDTLVHWHPRARRQNDVSDGDAGMAQPGVARRHR